MFKKSVLTLAALAAIANAGLVTGTSALKAGTKPHFGTNGKYVGGSYGYYCFSHKHVKVIWNPISRRWVKVKRWHRHCRR